MPFTLFKIQFSFVYANVFTGTFARIEEIFGEIFFSIIYPELNLVPKKKYKNSFRTKLFDRAVAKEGPGQTRSVPKSIKSGLARLNF